MRITLLAVGTRQPAWIDEGFREYQRRMPGHIELTLEEVPLVRRTSGIRTAESIRREGERLLRSIRSDDLAIALDEQGKTSNTAALARRLSDWLQSAPRVALMIGGPDGLSQECRERADETWSLSALTLPHGLVRIIVAEQLYRAWTLLQGHPYHRA